MTALTVHRTHVPFWPTVLLAAVAWLIAWIVNLPLANWAAYDLLGLEQGTQVGDAVALRLSNSDALMPVSRSRPKTRAARSPVRSGALG